MLKIEGYTFKNQTTYIQPTVSANMENINNNDGKGDSQND